MIQSVRFRLLPAIYDKPRAGAVTLFWFNELPIDAVLWTSQSPTTRTIVFRQRSSLALSGSIIDFRSACAMSRKCCLNAVLSFRTRRSADGVENTVLIMPVVSLEGSRLRMISGP
jgi:hypothetical protein